MWKFFLSNKNGMPVSVRGGLGDSPVLVSESVKVLDAHWKSSAITTAKTTTVVEARPNESILLTDLMIILSQKVTAATIIVQFYDGTNTVVLLTLDAASDSFQFSHAFQGGLRGFKDADLQVVTDNTTTLSVLVGYLHVSPGSTKPYAVWNAER